MLLALIFIASFWAGLQNSLAGGGSFVTSPALILSPYRHIVFPAQLEPRSPLNNASESDQTLKHHDAQPDQRRNHLPQA
jgi:hypothetical protein